MHEGLGSGNEASQATVCEANAMCTYISNEYCSKGPLL